jgi:hypothetical protein
MSEKSGWRSYLGWGEGWNTDNGIAYRVGYISARNSGRSTLNEKKQQQP